MYPSIDLMENFTAYGIISTTKSEGSFDSFPSATKKSPGVSCKIEDEQTFGRIAEQQRQEEKALHTQ